MFGHQDDQSQNDNDQPADNTIETANGTIGADSGIDQPSGAPPQPPHTWQHPGTPLENSAATAVPSDTKGELVIAPTGTPVVPAGSPSPASEDSSPDELLGIKQQALSQLSPLVGHLDQTPEEEFRTTMMMIQASDNKSLVKTAYAAAQKIEDEKARAQALLDIINEINYFTQHNGS